MGITHQALCPVVSAQPHSTVLERGVFLSGFPNRLLSVCDGPGVVLAAESC